MASISWTTGTTGLWKQATQWTPNTVPNLATDDVTIDAPATGGAYTVTIGTGESYTVNSLTMNASNNLAGANSNPYDAASLEVDGTLTFNPMSPGDFGGSLQTFVGMNNGTIVNAGTINAFVQAAGNDFFTGTHGIYFTNLLQSQGDVTVDTSSIAEYDAPNKTLFDGIFQAEGTGNSINLGGTLGGLSVQIDTIKGPSLNPSGWTELIYDQQGSAINKWNGTAYVPVASTLTDIAGGGTVDVLQGSGYSTTGPLSIDAAAAGSNGMNGMLNLQAGTVATGGLTINGGIVQGFATIAGNVDNAGTLEALGGRLTLAGNLTGTELRVFAARSRRRSSVGRTRGG